MWKFGLLIVPPLAMFYFIVWHYTRLYRTGRLNRGWDSPSIFFFALIMGVIWPLTLLWLLASRESRAERKIAKEMEHKRRLARIIAENEREARKLGLGEELDEY